jgi:hypothetical protein
LGRAAFLSKDPKKCLKFHTLRNNSELKLLLNALRTKQAAENNREHDTASTTHMRIRRTHAITAE